MLDAIILSDLHLGANNCQAKLLAEFFDSIKKKQLLTKKLILNGDVFDSFESRLKKSNWKILSDIRKLSDMMEVIWVRGNHDEIGPMKVVSHLIGAKLYEKEYVFEIGGKTILCQHGDVYDRFLIDHPFLINLADWFYNLLQKIDKSYWLAKLAKKSSKTYLHCMEIMKKEAVSYIKKHGYDIAVCGHSHFPEADENYFNSGSWVELPCSYLTVELGVIQLQKIHLVPSELS